jgi:peptide/nickel transport system substrate-binding protein
MNWIMKTIVSAALGLALTLGAAPAFAAPSGTLKFSDQVKLITFDPHSHSGGGIPYLRPVYETLFERTPDDKVVPFLATGYEVDGLTVTLTLRDDVVFSDGERFDANVVAANFKRSTGIGRLAGVKAIESAEAVDDFTVKLTLKEPAPSLIRDLSGTAGMMISPKAMEDPALDRNPVGTGPYVYNAAESREGEVRVYSPNPTYRDPDQIGLERLEIWEIPDDTARLNALKTGQIDLGIWLANPQSAIIDKTPGLKLIKNTGGYTYHLIILDREGTVVPAFADKRVRQAMNYALDREGFSLAVDFGLSTPAYQPYPEGHWAYNPNIGAPYELNLDKARELMKEAGYEDGFTFDMPSIPIYQPRLEAVAGFLREINITMNIVPVEPGTLARRSRTTDFPATNLSWPSANDPLYTMTYYVNEDGLFNPFRVKPSEEELELGAKGASSSDSEVRAPYYGKLMEDLNEESYLMFVTFSSLLFGVSEDIANNPTVSYRPGEDSPFLLGLRVDN